MHATHIIISQGITTYIYTYKKGGKGYLATKNTSYIANYCLDCAPLPECGPILFANTMTLINVNPHNLWTRLPNLQLFLDDWFLRLYI